jgi:hypothetical protein
MAKKAYLGIDNSAKLLKKAYIGIDGKARKIKKIYLGVNGLAKLVAERKVFTISYNINGGAGTTPGGSSHETL